MLIVQVEAKADCGTASKVMQMALAGQEDQAVGTNSTSDQGAGSHWP